VTEQLTLLPSERPAATVRHVPVGALYAVATRSPGRELVASVAALGVLQPLIAVPMDTSTRYRVLDGRRRLAAALEAGLETVPVAIYGGVGEALEHVIHLASHALRSANPIGEYDAICALLGAGATEKEIARDTGMPLGTVRARMKLKALNPDLEQAFRQGKIGVAVAEQVCRLPAQSQASLVTVLGETGKITDRDVHKAKEARTQTAMATLSFDQMVRATQSDTGPVEESLAPAERLCVEIDCAIVGGATDRARALVAELRGLVREK
jgi:ParB/RepB/Spo0J family partition protein